MKLDLACGANCAEDFEGVDIAKVNEKVKHQANLLAFPWPFADESVDEIRCSHFIEHLDMLFFTPPGSIRSDGYCTKLRDDPTWRFEDALTAVQVSDRSVDLFLKFFDECWRILKPGGTLSVSCPHGHSDRAFQDPSHRRFIVTDTWAYLDRDWRKANGLEHGAYGVQCHFPFARRQLFGRKSPEQERELAGMTPVTQDQTVARWWNMISDFHAVLTKEPTPVPIQETAPAAEVVGSTA